MQETRAKLASLEPVIKAKQLQVDHEASRLAAIRQEKRDLVAELKRRQQQYLDGVHQLNHERAQMSEGLRPALESGLDVIKETWHQTLQRVRRVETIEKQQLAVVMEVQRHLKSLELLQERYRTDLSLQERRREQSATDEAARRVHVSG